MTLILQRILTLIGKEFAMVMRDPKSRLVVIGPPIIQFFIFGYAATFDLTNVRYAVLDESRTPASRDLLARFEGSDNFDLVRTLESSQEIDQEINAQQARLVLHVPADFDQQLTQAGPAELQVILDGRNSNVASIALSYVNTIVQQHSSEISVSRDPSIAANAAGLELLERAWFNENLLSRWYIVSALGGVISMVVVTLLASLSVAREREFGTFDQLLVAPFRPTEILIGKATPGIAFGLADSLLLSAGAVYWFEVPFRGTLLALLAALTMFIIAIVGIGLFISSLSTTMQQGLLGSFVFVMPAVILGGFTTPIENMPPWLQTATLANPLRYVVAALRQVFLEGADVVAIAPQLWPMAIIVALTLPAAGWMFRHRAE
jgi:ABC-2 type transport system permease protein